jgi:hypothetical protein
MVEQGAGGWCCSTSALSQRLELRARINPGVLSALSRAVKAKQNASLHQQFTGSAHDGMLHLLQIILDHVQAVNALFKIAGKNGEEWSNLSVFEEFELGNDVVALFSRLHPIHEIFHTIAAEPERVDAFREHTGKKQRVVADMLAYLAFAIERRRRPEHRI